MFSLNFVNTSKLGCTLGGYADGMTAVTKSGKRIDCRPSPIASSYKTVTLLPGKAQSALLMGIVRDGQLLPVAVRAGHRCRTGEWPPPGQSKVVALMKTFSTCSSTSRDVVDREAGQLAARVSTWVEPNHI